MREQIAAHVLQDQLAHAGDLERAVAQRDLVEHAQHEHDHDEPCQQRVVPVRQHVVDDHFGQVRHGHRDAAHRDHDGRYSREPPAMRAQVSAYSAQIMEIDALLELFVFAVRVALCHTGSPPFRITDWCADYRLRIVDC